MNYFTITTNYNNSLSGGTTTCKAGSTTITNINTLAAGTYTVTCTMKTGAGKTASASTTINLRAFATDSWAVISSTVKAGYASVYKVGDTKEVAVSGYGTFTVRVANNTTPAECSSTNFSQTACGFVVEFADIITEYQMNSSNSNVGGWPATKMRTFLNSTIYNALPSDLKNIIINTKVISGHGSSDSSNFTSTDKLYLLSTKEVWGLYPEDDLYDSIDDSTIRQLDYYKNIGVTNVNYSGAIKTYNNEDSSWWLRSALSFENARFYMINKRGNWTTYAATSNSKGVAPAFRIG